MPRNFTEAVDLVRARRRPAATARRSTPSAMMYLEGRGVAADRAKAGRYFEKAADRRQGRRDLQPRPPLPRTATAPPADLARAAEAPHGRGEGRQRRRRSTSSAQLYDEGHGVPEDEAGAARWFGEAANAGQRSGRGRVRHPPVQRHRHRQGRGRRRTPGSSAPPTPAIRSRRTAWPGMLATGRGIAADPRRRRQVALSSRQGAGKTDAWLDNFVDDFAEPAPGAAAAAQRWPPPTAAPRLHRHAKCGAERRRPPLTPDRQHAIGPHRTPQRHGPGRAQGRPRPRPRLRRGREPAGLAEGARRFRLRRRPPRRADADRRAAARRGRPTASSPRRAATIAGTDTATSLDHRPARRHHQFPARHPALRHLDRRSSARARSSPASSTTRSSTSSTSPSAAPAPSSTTGACASPAARDLADAVIATGMPHIGQARSRRPVLAEMRAVMSRDRRHPPRRLGRARPRLGRLRPLRRLLGARPVAVGHGGRHRHRARGRRLSSPTRRAATTCFGTGSIVAGNEAIHARIALPADSGRGGRWLNQRRPRFCRFSLFANHGKN